MIVIAIFATGLAYRQELRLMVVGLWYRPWYSMDLDQFENPKEHFTFRHVAFSPDGLTLATVGRSASEKGILLSLRDVPTGHLRSRSVLGEEPIKCLLFAGDGETIATIAKDEILATELALADKSTTAPATVTRWSVESGVKLSTTSTTSLDLQSVALSRNGTILAIGTGGRKRREQGKVTLWDLRSNVVIGETDIAGGSVLTVEYSPDGGSLAVGTGCPGIVGDWKSSVSILDATTLRPLVPPLPHDDNIEFLAFSGDGKTLASADRRGVTKLWETRSWRERVKFNSSDNRIEALAISADGKTVATGFLYDASLWNGENGKDIGSFKVPLGNGGVRSLSFGRGGRSLAIICDEWQSLPSVIDLATGCEFEWGESRPANRWSQLILPPTLLAFGLAALIVAVRRIKVPRPRHPEATTAGVEVKRRLPRPVFLLLMIILAASPAVGILVRRTVCSYRLAAMIDRIVLLLDDVQMTELDAEERRQIDESRKLLEIEKTLLKSFARRAIVSAEDTALLEHLGIRLDQESAINVGWQPENMRLVWSSQYTDGGSGSGMVYIFDPIMGSWLGSQFQTIVLTDQRNRLRAWRNVGGGSSFDSASIEAGKHAILAIRCRQRGAGVESYRYDLNHQTIRPILVKSAAEDDRGQNGTPRSPASSR